MTNDIDNIAQSLQQTLSQMLNSILLLVGVAIMMFTISPLLAVVALTTVPRVGVRHAQDRRAGPAPVHLAVAQPPARSTRIVEEAFTGHAIVKSFGRQREVEARFREKNDELYESSFGAQFMSSLMQPVTMFLGNIQYVLVAVVGGLRVASGAISIGDIQAFIQYSRTVLDAAHPAGLDDEHLPERHRLARAGLRIPRRRGAEPRSAAVPAAAPTQGRVAFEDVTFSYDPDSAADRVALAGRRARSDHRHRRPDRGGQDHAGQPDHALLRARLRAGSPWTARHLDDATARAAVQDRHGAAGHLAVRRHHPRQHRLRQSRRRPRRRSSTAARATYVDRFVHSLPDGYDTLINEEADNISAGQKQLLTIARAFLADPSILILDEATSSVDTRTEVQIQEAMNRLRAERTSFVIAHRLSTIRGADIILVMEQGSIVEQGSHAELLATRRRLRPPVQLAVRGARRRGDLTAGRDRQPPGDRGSPPADLAPGRPSPVDHHVRPRHVGRIV